MTKVVKSAISQWLSEVEDWGPGLLPPRRALSFFIQIMFKYVYAAGTEAAYDVGVPLLDEDGKPVVPRYPLPPAVAADGVVPLLVWRSLACRAGCIKVVQSTAQSQLDCCTYLIFVIFYTHTFSGLKILHSKARKFTTKIASQQNSVNQYLVF